MIILFGYLLIVNVLGFLLMLIDKQKARKGYWRIPEAVLVSIAAFGGSLGTLTGMSIFRHKIRNPKFAIGVPLLFAIHFLLLFVIFVKNSGSI